jgi:hypothetical protein
MFHKYIYLRKHHASIIISTAKYFGGLSTSTIMARPAGNYFFGARGPKLVAAIVICAAVSFLLLGYDQGVLSGVLTNKHFVETMGYPSSSLIGIYDFFRRY